MAATKYAGENVLTQLITLIKANFLTKASGAEPNTIDTVAVNGAALTPDNNKKVDITVPTNNNQLINGAGYQTAANVSAAISSALAGITGISFEKANTLPVTGDAGTIYLIPLSTSGTNNVYEEYIYLDSAWELLGTTDVDLSDYIQTSDLVEFTNSEVLTIWNSIT